MIEKMAMTGLKHACLFDGSGGAHFLSWDEVQTWSPSKGLLWLHMDYTEEQVQDWIQNNSELDPVVSETLLCEETRPRVSDIGDGLLIALRGVNLNPGADPEDMVSIRLWIDNERIISTRKRDLLSVGDIVDQLKNVKGPKNSAEFIVRLTDRLVWRMSDTVDMFEDQIAELEEEVLTSDKLSLRSDLAILRRQTIAIRRYLSPEREALSKLLFEKVSWFDEDNHIRLREVSDRLTRHIEDIDAVRERASVTQEEILSQASEQLNKRMYVLSIIAAIFLPLSFFTGLLGINVGGIPGSDNPLAFTIVILLLLIVVLFQLLLFKWKKWL